MALMTKRLADFPMNSNPFHHDHYRMGQDIGNDWTVMYDHHDNNDFIIIVHRVSGERIMISAVLPQDIRTMTSLDTPL